MSLVDGQDGSYTELNMTPSPAPVPQWDNDKKIALGTCTKGWVALIRRQRLVWWPYIQS